MIICCMMDHKFFINLYKNFGKPNYLNTTGAFFRIHENSKTSKFEKILFKERRKKIDWNMLIFQVINIKKIK